MNFLKCCISGQNLICSRKFELSGKIEIQGYYALLISIELNSLMYTIPCLQWRIKLPVFLLTFVSILSLSLTSEGSLSAEWNTWCSSDFCSYSGYKCKYNKSVIFSILHIQWHSFFSVFYFLLAQNSFILWWLRINKFKI